MLRDKRRRPSELGSVTLRADDESSRGNRPL